MTQHDHKKHPHGQDHHHGSKRPTKALHKDWRSWVVVGLMLAAIVMYVLSDDESIQPGGQPGQEMPAAPAAE